MSAFIKLSSIDCANHIEKKGNLSYLSWAWAWKTLLDHYPDSTFEFEKTESGSEFWPLADGSGEVRCSLTVDNLTRTCWLPVMDYRNKAIENPNARDLNDAKMRCLVKTIALFGLGLYIYAGEDIPSPNNKSSYDDQKPQSATKVPQKEEDEFTLESPKMKSEIFPKDAIVPLGKWEGKLMTDLTRDQLEKLWEYRSKFADYVDFTSNLQNWRKSL